MELGVWVRSKREELGWTQAELSLISGIPQTTISGWETGKTVSPTVTHLADLAKAYQMRLSDIFSIIEGNSVNGSVWLAMNEAAMEHDSRIPFYEIAHLANGGTLRTFRKKIYQIKGIMVQDSVTGEVLKLSSVYYEIRTVKNSKGQVIARRKNPIDELKRVWF